MKGFSGFKSSPAKQKSNMPKDFNMIGSSGSGKKILTKQEKSAKHKQNFDARQASKQQGKEFVENLKKRGDLTPEAKTKMATDFNYENKKAQNQKLLQDKHLKKKVRKKAIKKVAGKIASRAIPGAGWALAATDAYGIGKKMYKGASFKDAAKEQFLGIKTKK
mgnify:CR=1 FL=1